MTIRLSFLGAARNVTGSRYLVETDSARVLVDCGLYQERQLQHRNWERFTVDPRSIDAVVLTHAHLDHCGLLPKLAHEGFSGPVFCTPATVEIVPVVLEDSARLQTEDAKFKAKRHRREGRKSPRKPRPLYTVEDVRRCVDQFEEAPMNEPVPIADGITATFRGAGHILGSTSIRLAVTDGGITRTLLFSGDVGRYDRPIIKDPDPFESADYVVTESTYGDRLHDNHEDIQDRLSALINETHASGGNILIPSFAIERAQEVLYRLNQLMQAKRIPPLMVFLDSPMAAKVTQVFRRHAELYDEKMAALVAEGSEPFGFHGLKITRTRRDSQAINSIRGTAIIIAGSGMCTGGRIKHHLIHNIERPESALLFVGYQANGTLGRILVEGAPNVRILGRRWDVRLKVDQVQGFSGHADQAELLQWLQKLERPPRQVFVTHGGESVSQRFAVLIHGRTGWPAMAPKYRTTVELD